MAPNINKAYQWAINTCNAPNVGYSMAYRYQQTVNGITYYDCSSFIWYALKDGGFPLTGSAFTTRSMIPILLDLGFTQVNVFSEWKPGNILWRQGHTEMVYEGGQGQGRTMGAHTDDYPLADQVSIYPHLSSGADWSLMFQYQGGATGGYGSNMYVISAIAANFKRSSNLNPAHWENNSPGSWTDTDKGYGLGQWKNLNAAPSDGYIPPMTWVYSYYIGSSTGNVIYSSGHKYAMTEIFQVGAGDIIVNNTPTTVGGYRYISEFVFYKTTNTLNDTYMYTRSVTGTATFTVPADCTGMRIQIGRRSADPVILEPTNCEDNVKVKIRSVSRLHNMYLWMTENGHGMDDGDGQIDFFQNESYWLTTGPGAAWTTDYPAFKDFLSDFENNNLEELTEIFFNCWRGLSSSADAAELTATKEESEDVYNFILKHYNDPDAAWTARTAGITDDEANMNAVMLFRTLSAGIGGGGGIQPDYQFLLIPKFLYMKRPKQVVVKLMR